MSNTITTLSGFFQSSGFQFRIFDMGRRVVPFDAEAFLAIEQAQLPYPYPLQRQAWIGLIGWPEEHNEKHFIWFLRLPLDEYGHLSYAARDDLLRRLMKMADQGINGADASALQSSMDDNPFGYKPSEERMAVFHAKARKLLGLPPSQYYAAARDYFAGELGLEHWTELGLQGIAEVTARLEEEQNALHLAEIFTQLPQRPFEVVCQCLENERLDMNLSQAIVQRASQLLKEAVPDAAQVSLCLRAMAISSATGMRRNLLEQVLDSSIGTDIQILVAIAGRCWEDLTDEMVLHVFLSALAQNSGGQEVFDTLLTDLFTIPGMRVNIMTTLRNPQRSESLSAALGQFFTAIRS